MSDFEHKATKAHCPQCGPNRNAHVMAEYVDRYEALDGDVWGTETYGILKCAGCDTCYVRKISVFSENIDQRKNPVTGEWELTPDEKTTFWPSPIERAEPKWSMDINLADGDLGSLFDDIYVALNNNLSVLAAIGVRTAFDRASELLGVDPDLSFTKKLSALLGNGKIGNDERDHLEVLTNAGSAAAHRGWKPTADELGTMMSILEQFLYRNFVLRDEVRRLKRKVPERAK